MVLYAISLNTLVRHFRGHVAFKIVSTDPSLNSEDVVKGSQGSRSVSMGLCKNSFARVPCEQCTERVTFRTRFIATTEDGER